MIAAAGDSHRIKMRMNPIDAVDGKLALAPFLTNR